MPNWTGYHEVDWDIDIGYKGIYLVQGYDLAMFKKSKRIIIK